MYNHQIAGCYENSDVSDMRTVTIEKKNPLYVMLMLAVLELVAGFVPWATIWYGEIISGESVSCISIPQLMQDMSYYQSWADDIFEIQGSMLFFAVLILSVVILDAWLLKEVICKNEKGTVLWGKIVGGSGISVAGLFGVCVEMLKGDFSNEEWRIVSLRRDSGGWFMLIVSIGLLVAAFWCEKIVQENRKKQIYEIEVLNYDPVLPVRIHELRIQQGDYLKFNLICRQFDWKIIDTLVADIQLITEYGDIVTLSRNMAFTRLKNDQYSAKLSEVNYNFENIQSAKINIKSYSIENEMEAGSGYSVDSDYSLLEIKKLRAMEPRAVVCKEKNFIAGHCCSCGQIYSNELYICPLCGKKKGE